MQLVGIVGQINSGKDTIANILIKQYGFIRFSMADPLKVLCHEFFGVPQENLWGPSSSRTDKVRTLLQTLGTEVARKYDPDIWVKKFEERITSVMEYGRDNLGLQTIAGVEHKIVVPDVRFPNEASKIRSLGGIVIRVTRVGNYRNVCTPADQQSHISETVQLDIPSNALIKNNGTLQELEMLVHDTYEMLFPEDKK